jgi:hypothetical protein
MGSPVDGDDLKPRLAELLKRPAAAIDGASATESRPRRLGRTIKDFDLGKDR